MTDAKQSKLGPGPIILVVGPSGVGKDTLLSGASVALADEQSVIFPRRTITRTADPALEDHASLSVRQFEAAREAGGFALCWEAHGLHYGIPAEIDGFVKRGITVVFNASRRAIAAASLRYHRVKVIEISAPPDVLAARLAARGRESDAEITGRLNRAGGSTPPGVDYIRLDNTASVEAGVARLVELIRKAA